jgi:Glycosyl transferases group 1
MLVVTSKTEQNTQCYSYEKLFTSLDLYFNNIFYYDIQGHSDRDIHQKNIFDIIEKNNINTVWFFRSYYNPALYEHGNFIMYSNLSKQLIEKKLNIIFSCSDLDNISRDGSALIHFLNNLAKYPKFYIFDNFMYKNLLKKRVIIDRKRFIQVKHFAYPEFYEIEFNKTPQNKVILSGAVNECYPSRVEYKKYAKENEDRVFVAPRNDESSEKKYYHILNEYLAGFAGVARGTGFILAKFFEIPASGSLLLAYVDDIKELNDVGFYDGINCLVIKNKDQYQSITEYILNPDNKDKIDKIRQKGRETIIQNHTLEHRLKQFEEIFDMLLSNIKKKI